MPEPPRAAGLYRGGVEASDVRDIVAENIRTLVRKRGMTLNELAETSGVSRSQLFNVLGRESSASLDWLAKLAAALDVAPWELLMPGASRHR